MTDQKCEKPVVFPPFLQQAVICSGTNIFLTILNQCFITGLSFPLQISDIYQKQLCESIHGDFRLGMEERGGTDENFRW